MSAIKKTLLAAAICQLFAACASTSPNVDQHFGEAVRAARAQQIINPAASLNPDPVAGIDAKASKESMDRYQDSFKAPPPSFEVINIGGGLSAGSGK